MSNDPIQHFAQSLIADGHRDREVLRRRWNTPSWRPEVEQIANLLQQYPLLIPIVSKVINDELARLNAEIDNSTHDESLPNPKAKNDADRQNETLPDIREEPAS